MDPTTSFIVDLSLLLAAAFFAGEIANRFGQPALVGQLLAGLLLGPTLIGPYLGLSSLSAQLSAVQILATVFILFLAGLDLIPEQIYGMGAATLAIGLLVFAGPFVVISGVIILLDPALPLLTALFVGLTLSITALPVLSIMLTEFGLARTTFGRTLMNVALVNELAAVSVFAVLLQLRGGAGNQSLALLIAPVAVALFISTMLAIHMFLRWLRSTRWWSQLRARFAAWKTREAGFALLLVLVLSASLYSQFLGLTFVVGAFYAGLLVTQESAGKQVHRSISRVFDTISWGFFIPLFFALVGVEMNLRLLESIPELLLFGALLGAAVLTKVVTGYAGARARRWNPTDALAAGHLVSSRGAVELAMAVILLTSGVFSVQLFTIVAGVGLVATILSPIGAVSSWAAVPQRQRGLERGAPSVRPALATRHPFRGLIEYILPGEESHEPEAEPSARPDSEPRG